MGTKLLEIDGTADEIAARLKEFADRRLHVVVSEAQSADRDPRLELLREIRDRAATMNSRPVTRDYLREGRAGDMYGYEPGE